MTRKVRIFPHNDLLNLAHFNLGVINEHVGKDDHEGLALHCMNCIVSTAFAVEAFINFMGSKKVEKWNERTKWYKKLQQICKAVGYEYNLDKDPLATIEKVKDIRNELAHGKPIEKMVEVGSKDELKQAMESPWSQCCTPEYANISYEQVNIFINEVIAKSGLKIFDTLTSSNGESNA